MVFPIDIVQKILEIGHHVWGRYNHSHLAKTTEPDIELVADCNLGGNNKAPVTVRSVEYISACAEAGNHCVQKVISKPQAHMLLLTAEHSEVLLCVYFHVDFGEF